MTEIRLQKRPFRLMLVLLLAVLASGLSHAVLSLPSQAAGLSASVAENIDASGVSNPVTAVLLNFRGYDTLLELGVLLIALLGVWSLSPLQEHGYTRPGAVLDMLTRLLVPLLILVSGYLLWAGAHAPGGAFQAGSVLAAAGVLMVLTGWCLGYRFTRLPLRFALVSGLGVFVIAGLIMMCFSEHFLEYPSPFAGAFILFIEAAATVSIGTSLAALFIGSRPQLCDSSSSQAEEQK